MLIVINQILFTYRKAKNGEEVHMWLVLQVRVLIFRTRVAFLFIFSEDLQCGFLKHRTIRRPVMGKQDKQYKSAQREGNDYKKNRLSRIQENQTILRDLVHV
ncbi:hypothetical protein LXL04_032598 [Taraxacum kok-saghyz]